MTSPIEQQYSSFSEAMSHLPWWLLTLLFVLLFTQSAIIFFRGRAIGIKGYWALAIWGLTTCPMPILLFWFISHRKKSRAQIKQDV